MSDKPSRAAIPLPKGKRSMVQWGCVCLMLSIAMFGLSLATLQEPILQEMGAMNYFSLLSILATLGLSIMTPIGGKLGDLFGRRNLVIVSGLICATCSIGMGLFRSLLPFMLLRLLLGAAQGAFTAAPYILVREINEPEAVPKAMGLLASSVAVGGFIGSWIAGFLTDLGLLSLAIMFPVIPLLTGVALIAFALPNRRPQGRVKLDIPGIAALTVALSGLLLGLNFGPRVGWLNPWVLAGFAVGIFALFILIKVERKSEEPLIPLHLFGNSRYNLLLAVSFSSYFYNTAMNYYAPLAVLQVLGKSTAVSGSLQLPRTILTIFLPTVFGIWVGRNARNNWLAMLGSSALITSAFLGLSFTTPQSSVLLFFLLLGLTGIAESLRSVSLTPAAQATLAPQDMGIGTSLISFVNSLSNLLASASLGIVYDLNAAEGTVSAIASGVNGVFLTTAIISAAGVGLILWGMKRQ